MLIAPVVRGKSALQWHNGDGELISSPVQRSPFSGFELKKNNIWAGVSSTDIVLPPRENIKTQLKISLLTLDYF